MSGTPKTILYVSGWLLALRWLTTSGILGLWGVRRGVKSFPDSSTQGFVKYDKSCFRQLAGISEF